MIKLFACDLDGTLLNKYHETDEIILNAVNQVIENHRYFAIATGRHMHENQKAKLGMHDDGVYTICMNGAWIFDPKGNSIYENYLDQQFLSKILKTFPTIDFECIGKDHTYLRISKEQHIKEFEKRSIWKKVLRKTDINEFMKDCLYEQSDEAILKQGIMKINCRVEDEQLHHDLTAFIQANSDIVVNAPFQDEIFEITDKSVNKGEAVTKLAQHLNISEDEVAVYGDGGNDLEMLGRFHYAYATENASDAAKTAAGNVIGHCDDHAVPMHIVDIIEHDII